MNSLQAVFHQPWVSQLGWTLLHFLWQGTLIAALLSVSRGLPGRRTNPQSRYLAACLALAAMAAAPVATFVLISGSGGPASPAALSLAAQAVGAGGGAASLPPISAWDRVSPWLGAAWLVGMLLCSLRLFGAWLAAARLRSTRTRPAPPEWLPRLAALTARMEVRRPVRLLVSSLVDVPAVIGWMRPLILVPVGSLAGLPAAQVEALLAHELAHIRRHDYLINLLQSLAEAVLFYHPAVWWVSRQIRIEREHCCDDIAVETTGVDVVAYARALAELATCRTAHSHAMAATGGSLRERIRRLLDPSRPASHTLPARGPAWALIAMVFVGIGAVLSCGTQKVAAQEAVVDRQTIWPDTVKQGDIKLEVRGLGTLTSVTAAEVKLASVQSKDVIAGQPVEIAFRGGHDTIAGRVRTVRPGVTNGVVTAEVDVTAALPSEVHTGDPIDATITIGAINNVVYVGRPVFGKADGEATLFKIDPDGQHATKVKVRFGHESVNQIEIKSGLQPGDRVILSSMTAYEGFERITLK